MEQKEDKNIWRKQNGDLWQNIEAIIADFNTESQII